MDNVRVTVLLPTYNRGDQISDALDSIVNQTYTDFKLIIIDDGSIDNTRSICNKYINDNISYYKNDNNIGLPATRDKALKMTNSELVMFTEDDLILTPDCLEILVREWDSKNENGYAIGAIGPRLITDFSKYSKYIHNDSNNHEVVSHFNPRTGLLKTDYSINCSKTIEVEMIHACSLINRIYAIRLGGYDVKCYRGNFH